MTFSKESTSDQSEDIFGNNSFFFSEIAGDMK